MKPGEEVEFIDIAIIWISINLLIQTFYPAC